MKILVNTNFFKLLKIALIIICSVGITGSIGSEPLLKKKGFTRDNSQAYLIDDFSIPVECEVPNQTIQCARTSYLWEYT